MTDVKNRNRKPSALDMKLLRFIASNRFFDAADHDHGEMFPRHEHTVPRLLNFELIELVDVSGVHVYHTTAIGAALAREAI